MKATELRIGNYASVTYENTKADLQIGQVSNSFDGIASVRCLEWMSLPSTFIVQPIPLTEEWLVKFGFYDKYKSVHKQWCIKGMCIQQAADTNDEGKEIPVKQEFTYDYKVDIKHVHQLQNLYHALTNKELEIT